MAEVLRSERLSEEPGFRVGQFGNPKIEGALGGDPTASHSGVPSLRAARAETFLCSMTPLNYGFRSLSDATFLSHLTAS